jgi:CBS domain-containing protein
MDHLMLVGVLTDEDVVKLLMGGGCTPDASVIARAIFKNFTLPMQNNMSVDKVIRIS